MMALRIEQDDERDTVTVEGAIYAQALLRDLSHALPIGEPFAIVKRADGVITVQRLAASGAPMANDAKSASESMHVKSDVHTKQEKDEHVDSAKGAHDGL